MAGTRGRFGTRTQALEGKLEDTIDGMEAKTYIAAEGVEASGRDDSLGENRGDADAAELGAHDVKKG